LLSSDREQQRAARNKRSRIPLNEVSRVRIPPPPLRKRRICRNNARAKKWAGFTPGPYYTNGYTNAARIPSFAAASTAFVIVYLYSRLPDLVVAISMQCGSAQPRSVSLSTLMHDPASEVRRIYLPETVWKLLSGSILWPLSLQNGAKWRLFGRFALPRNVRSGPHSDFPDSLWKVNSPKFTLVLCQR
jgi:hypothetical protein